MRCFCEETGNKTPKENLIIIDNKDSEIIYKAMEEFTKNNPKNQKAKALLKEMFTKWAF